jgi:hypothetical protein
MPRLRFHHSDFPQTRCDCGAIYNVAESLPVHCACGQPLQPRFAYFFLQLRSGTARRESLTQIATALVTRARKGRR